MVILVYDCWSDWNMERIPRIKKAEPSGNVHLLISFDNGIKKIYDCEHLFSRSQFRFLKDPSFFRSVSVDPGGYGISWNDDLDISEYELWTNGSEV